VPPGDTLNVKIMSQDMLWLAAATTLIHLVGIGGLILWMALGRPLSVSKFKERWHKQKRSFLPKLH
jgi:hypothetical protein